MEAHRVAEARAAARAGGQAVWKVVQVGVHRVAEEDALGGPQECAADAREEVAVVAGAVMVVEVEVAPKEEEVGEPGGRLERAADATVEAAKVAAACSAEGMVAALVAALEAGQLAVRKVAQMEAQRVAAARVAARAAARAEGVAVLM